jgi:hypothetical protein
MRTGEEHMSTRATLTKPEDPEEADEAKFTASQGGDGTFAEEIDNEA